MKKILKFIYVFLIIGLESLGNMSAVAVVLEENLIKKNKLVTEEDIIDAVSLSRLGPGAITANAVTYLGNKIAGFWGGALATVCYTIAPMVVMIAIYGIIERILEHQFVTSALKGALIFICVMFIKSTHEMGKNVLSNNKFNKIIFVVSILILEITGISSVWIIIGAVVLGLIKINWNKCRAFFSKF